jgi:hypothetical protein
MRALGRWDVTGRHACNAAGGKGTKSHQESALKAMDKNDPKVKAAIVLTRESLVQVPFQFHKLHTLKTNTVIYIKQQEK